MRKRSKKISKQEILDGLRELAFGNISDAVSLLYKTDEEIREILPTLNLGCVSEIKRPKDGAMEIKLADRFKAIDMLCKIYEKQSSVEPVSFYEALEKSVTRRSDDTEEKYEQ